MKDQLVFVYGTLKYGFTNHDCMWGDYLCAGVTEDRYLMYSNGAYPTVTPDEDGVEVKGELYVCDESAMERLDALESNGYLYTREERTIVTEAGRVRAWIYLFNHDHTGHQVVSGEFTQSDYRNVWE